MSLLLSLLLTGGLSVKPDATADLVSIQAPTVGKKNRRPSRKPSPKAPLPEMPPIEDLPLGAQDLLMTNTGESSKPSTGRPKPNRLSSQQPTDNDGSGVSPTSAESSADGEPSDEERLSSEAAWRIAVDEAREKLRAAEEESRQQGNADNDAALRVTKARQRLTRLLEKGRAKQYRELPKPVEMEP